MTRAERWAGMALPEQVVRVRIDRFDQTVVVGAQAYADSEQPWASARQSGEVTHKDPALNHVTVQRTLAARGPPQTSESWRSSERP